MENHCDEVEQGSERKWLRAAWIVFNFITDRLFFALVGAFLGGCLVTYAVTDTIRQIDTSFTCERKAS